LTAANEQIDTAVANLEDIQKTVADLEAPKVIGGYIYEGQVLVRSGESYMADIYNIVNADYVYSDLQETGTTYVTFEDFYVKGSEASVLFYEPMGQKTYANTAAVFETAPLLLELPAVQADQVWAFEPDWFQNVDKLDQIVADYAAIVHQEAFPDHEMQYMVQVPAQ
jgi:iron complex transport system substrate-binding protein